MPFFLHPIMFFFPLSLSNLFFPHFSSSNFIFSHFSASNFVFPPFFFIELVFPPFYFIQFWFSPIFLYPICFFPLFLLQFYSYCCYCFVYIDTDPLREWDYLPPVGARPMKGFCGLKNAGATCYMNSVLQQLYMVPSIRVGILQADGAAINENEDFSGDMDVNNHISSAVFFTSSSCTTTTTTTTTDDSGLGGGSGSGSGGSGGGGGSSSSGSSGGTSLNSNSSNSSGVLDVRKNYHVNILKHVQAIFAHLGHSALQFYVPRGLWTHFK